jgi:hypothetical protein
MVSVGGEVGIVVVESPRKFRQMEHTPIIKMSTRRDAIDRRIDLMNRIGWLYPIDKLEAKI